MVSTPSVLSSSSLGPTQPSSCRSTSLSPSLSTPSSHSGSAGSSDSSLSFCDEQPGSSRSTSPSPSLSTVSPHSAAGLGEATTHVLVTVSAQLPAGEPAGLPAMFSQSSSVLL